MALSCRFSNDNGVEILLPEHPYSHEFIRRDGHEVIFRRINAYLMNNRIIGHNVVDAGCWVGDNAVPWAKIVSGTGVVYAIDPSPANCAFVRAVKELNRLDNLTILEEALGESRGRVSTDDDLHHCKLSSDDRGRNRIDTTSIDLLFREGKIQDVGYIHLDVEGMESAVILGARHAIREFRPVLTFEQHLDSDDHAGLVGALRRWGYVTFLIEEILPGCRSDCRNFLALPAEACPPDLASRLDALLGTTGIILPR